MAQPSRAPRGGEPSSRSEPGRSPEGGELSPKSKAGLVAAGGELSSRGRPGSGGAARTEPPTDAAAGAVFAALADPTRRHLLAALAERGGGTATGLAAELPISRQAVAKHLATLGRAGLVSQSRNGRESRFELDPRPLTDAAAWLSAVGAEWDGRLADLQRLLGR